MPALLIKDLPTDGHARLKREARARRRSMTQQVIVLFEARMGRFKPVHFPPPFKTRTPLTAEFDAHALEPAVSAVERAQHTAETADSRLQPGYIARP